MRRPPPKPEKPVTKEPRINERIRVPQIRVVGSDGSQLGIMSPDEALRRAESEGLDLVEVAPDANPPVCRIMDFGRFKYQQKKRTAESKKKATVTKLKEIKIRPKTEENDYQVKLRHVREFIDAGDKVKITMMFRGREIAYSQLGLRTLLRMIQDLSTTVIVEREPKLEGKNMIMLLSPSKTGGGGPAHAPQPAQAQAQQP